MKNKFLIIFLIALFTSTIYVGAKTISDTPTYSGQFQGSRMMNRLNLTDEEHELIFEKRIELTFTYLSNYSSMTSEERLQAETNYNDALKAYVLEVLGETQPNLEYQFGSRMMSRLSEESRQLVVEKRVELTIKYFSNYSLMTDEEIQVAQDSFRNEMRTFNQSLQRETAQCQGGQRQLRNGRMGRR